MRGFSNMYPNPITKNIVSLSQYLKLQTTNKIHKRNNLICTTNSRVLILKILVYIILHFINIFNYIL